jgi:hypothetical protein
MDGEWWTYKEAAERVGSTAEAVRYRALRGKWPRRRGNDGKARIQLPDNAQDVRTPSERPVRTPSAPRADQALSHALESHIKTLQGENEALKQQLSATEARLAAADAERGQAIAAFAALADRLDEIAAARARPWWRRLAG